MKSDGATARVSLVILFVLLITLFAAHDAEAAACRKYGGRYLVCGAIQTRYVEIGQATGPLGRSLSHERPTPDGVGRFQEFEHGLMYWHPRTGAWEVYGAIRIRYGKLKWELGPLGYPKSGERPTPDGVGRFQEFEHGLMYWRPRTGAWEVYGAIRLKYGELGWENGLGYPISGERGQFGAR